MSGPIIFASRNNLDYKGDEWEAGVAFAKFENEDGETIYYCYGNSKNIVEVPLKEIGSKDYKTYAIKEGESKRRLVDDEEPYIHDEEV